MMKNSISSLVIALFILMLIAGGCSDRNPDAPPPGQIHPAGWISSHATEAETQLAGCQICHGIDFAGSAAAVSCFSCHPSGPPFSFHPGGWVDVVVDHQAFARTLSWTTCATAICHGPTLEGGNAGPSCFNVVCHGPEGNPPAPHALPFVAPTAHGPEARVNQIICRNCHGRPTNNFNGGFVANRLTDPTLSEINPNGNCSSCHPSAAAHPTNWQGSNDPDPVYAASHRGIDTTTQERSCALCHLTTGPGAAPRCFSASHTNADNSATTCHASGPRTAPHPIDGSFRLGANHGPVARADLANCKACHGQATTTNPRFNVPIGNLPAGCETCHNDNTAHPSAGARKNVRWYDGQWRHSTGTRGTNAAACGMCHPGIGGTGSIGPSCFSTTSCHRASPIANSSGCISCHGLPANGAGVAGNQRPNRQGAHRADSVHITTCDVCHGPAFGPGNINHFDQTTGATVIMRAGSGMTATQSATNTTCTGNCHGSQSWY